MITTEMKDRLLALLVRKTDMRLEGNIRDMAETVGANAREVEAVLEQFAELGYCHVDEFLGGHVRIVVKADAHDMFARGGFAAKEKIYEKELKKLVLEVEALQKEFPERANALGSIVQSLTGILSLIFR